jgi:hypothetical protein
MGTTLAAITLARSLAKQDGVVLVDLALDAQTSSVIASRSERARHQRAGAGLGTVQADHHRDRHSRVHVITAGPRSRRIRGHAPQRLAIREASRACDTSWSCERAAGIPRSAAKFAPRCADGLDDPATAAAATLLATRLRRCERAREFAGRASLDGTPTGQQPDRCTVAALKNTVIRTGLETLYSAVRTGCCAAGARRRRDPDAPSRAAADRSSPTACSK